MRVKKFLTSAIIIALSLLALVGLSLTSSVKIDFIGRTQTSAEISGSVVVNYSMDYYKNDNGTVSQAKTEISFDSTKNPDNNHYVFKGQKLGSPVSMTIANVKVDLSEYSFSYAKGNINIFTTSSPIFVGEYVLKITKNSDMSTKNISFKITKDSTSYNYVEFDYSKAYQYNQSIHLYSFTGYGIAPKYTIYNSAGNIVTPTVDVKYLIEEGVAQSITPIYTNNGKKIEMELSSTTSGTFCYAKSDNYVIMQSSIKINDENGTSLMISNISDQATINQSLFDTYGDATRLQFIGDNYKYLYLKAIISGKQSELNSSLYKVTTLDNNGVIMQDGVYAPGKYSIKLDINYSTNVKEADFQFINENGQPQGSITFPFEIVATGSYLRPQYEFLGANLDSDGIKYNYTFDGSIHFPIISFVDFDNKFCTVDPSAYIISFQKKLSETGTDWIEQQTPPVFSGTYRTVLKNAPGYNYFYNSSFYSSAYGISETGSAFAIKINVDDKSNELKDYIQKNSVNGTLLNLFYSGKELPINFKSINAQEVVTDDIEKSHTVKYYKVDNYISQHDYSGITELVGAPIELGYYYAELNFTETNSTRKTPIFQIIPGTVADGKNLIYVDYNKTVRYQTSDTLNVKLKQSDGTQILIDNLGVRISFKEDKTGSAFSETTPTAAGKYIFKITISASANIGFFNSIDTNSSIGTSNESAEYKFEIKSQALKVNVTKVYDKFFDAKADVRVDFARNQDGKITIYGIDGNDNVYIDETKSTIKFVTSIDDTSENSNVKYDANRPTQRTVYIKLVLAGTDSNKYTIEDMFFSAMISPKNVYIKGETIDLFFHETAETKISCKLYDDGDYKNLWVPINSNGVSAVGSPSIDTILDCGKYEISYAGLKFDGDDSGNYAYVMPQQSHFVNVKKTIIELEIEPISKNFRDEDSNVQGTNKLKISYHIDPSYIVNGYKINEVVFTRAQGETVGKYLLSIASVVLSRTIPGGNAIEQPIDLSKPLEYKNYTFKLKQEYYFVINKRPIAIKLQDFSAFYGVKVTSDMLRVSQLITGLYSEDSITPKYTIGDDPQTYTPAGTYAIDFVRNETKILDKNKLDVTANYDIKINDAKCVINKRNITVVVEDPMTMLSKIYGELDPIIKGIQLDLVTPQEGYGLLKEHTMSFEFFRFTDTNDYNSVGTYQITQKNKFEVKDKSDSVVTANYQAIYSTEDVKFNITHREMRLSLRPILFEIGLAADEVSYEHFKSLGIHNYLVYDLEAFQYNDTSASIPVSQRPSFGFVPYAELKEGPNTIEIKMPVAKNYKYVAKNGTMTVQKRNHISVVGNAIEGNNITGYKTFLADNKIWKSNIMYKVETKNGNPPDEGVKVDVVLSIPKDFVVNADSTVLYYIEKDGAKPIAIESFVISPDGDKITFAAEKFGYYVLAEDSGQIKTVLFASIGGGLGLMIIVIVLIVVLLKLKAKKLDKLSEVAFVKDEETFGDEGEGEGEGDKNDEDVSDLLQDTPEAENLDTIDEPDSFMTIDDNAFIQAIEEKKDEPVVDEPVVEKVNDPYGAGDMVDFSGDFSHFNSDDGSSYAFSNDEPEIVAQPTVVDEAVADFSEMPESKEPAVMADSNAIDFSELDEPQAEETIATEEIVKVEPIIEEPEIVELEVVEDEVIEPIVEEPTSKRTARAKKKGKKGDDVEVVEPISKVVEEPIPDEVEDASEDDDGDPEKKERRPRIDVDVENEEELRKFLESLDL